MKRGLFINWTLLMLIALVLASWSFVRFDQKGQEEAENWTSNVLSFDWGQELGTESEVQMIQRNGRDAVSILPGSSASLFSESDSELHLNFNEGAVLLSTLSNDFSVSLKTDFLEVKSQGGIAYVESNEDASQITIYAIEHPSLVSFLEDGEVLNQLSVPAGYRVSVSSSKVSSTLGLLRLTKLVKEFPAFIFDESELAEAVQAQLIVQRQSYTESEVAMLTDLQTKRDLGPSITDGANAFYDLSAWVKETLTVLPHAEEQLQMDTKKEVLSYAMSHYLVGQNTTADAWLSEWVNLNPSSEELHDLNSELFFVLPGEDLYPVKEQVIELLLSGDDPFHSLQLQFNDIESLIEGADLVNAEEAYELYQTDFMSALDEGYFDDEEWLDEISREYVLLELLLRSHSNFYKVESLELLAELEEKILSLAGSDQDLDEEKQAFVQSKIRFLTNLFDFVVDRKVSVNEGTLLAEELTENAQDYLDSIANPVAVTEYFANLVDDFKVATDYINSPEFYSYADFDEGLTAYNTKVDDLDELNEYIQDLRSGDDDISSSLTLEEALDQIAEDMLLAGVTYANLEWLGDSSYRLFEIQGARISSYSFEASYDRESQIVFDLVVDDVRFSTGLLLENLRDVVESTIGEQSVQSESSEAEDSSSVEQNSSSLTESVALQSVANAFEEANLFPVDYDFEIVDLEANIFLFDGSITERGLAVSGMYDLVQGQVTEVVWDYDGELRTLPSLKLDQLESAINATVDALIQLEDTE